MKQQLTCVDLFCGAGGFSRGFLDAGYDVVLGVDYDDAALETFQRNIASSELSLFVVSIWPPKITDDLLPAALMAYIPLALFLSHVCHCTLVVSGMLFQLSLCLPLLCRIRTSHVAEVMV